MTPETMVYETIVIDLDGTITPFPLYNPKIRLPWFLFFFYVPVVLVARPNRAVVEYMENIIERGGKVLIVTARPVQVTNLTKILLARRQVPFTKLFCVGGGREANRRKLDIILGYGAKLVVDNDERVLQFFHENNVPTVSVTELLTPSE